jgi:hypothetical protein
MLSAPLPRSPHRCLRCSYSADHAMKVEAFEREACRYLPGFLYSFNIADLKRRNAHLGHLEGDRDIAELDRLLATEAPRTGLVARTHGQRWLMISREDATRRVRSMLDRYSRTDALVTGWSISAKGGYEPGERRTETCVVPCEIERAVRCLYAEVATPEELSAAIVTIADNDYDLPVNEPVALDRISALPRTRCEGLPACPVCGRQNFEWHDGYDCIFSGDGRCKSCSEISITQRDVVNP